MSTYSESIRGSNGLRRLTVLTVAISAVVFGLFVPPAQAAPTSGFSPGNIISDSIFFSGKSMTAAEVQAFLNKRVPKCIINSGKPEHKAGAKFKGTTVAAHCLRSYSMKTPSKAANAYCKSYRGSTKKESAATIIAKVGEACNISPKVLLVLLEKEQKLVTDTWPTNLQYRSATGYGCPDTAPCSSEFYGFFNQVYRAAWTFQNYRINQKSYGYQKGKTNKVYWHPNHQCGSSQLRIENDATAGLYIYTPYRPNQAALSAGWGVGSDCSSYGNRNFYLMFTNWFGTTHFAVDSRFQKLHTQLGGVQGSFGSPTSAIKNSAQGGKKQEFAGGTMYWSSATGSSAIKSAIRTRFNALGGVSGQLGYPKGAEVKIGKGATQSFAGGDMFWSSQWGAVPVRGGIRTHYLSLGGATGVLGMPKSAEVAVAGGSRQSFAGGDIFWSAKNGATVQGQRLRASAMAADPRVAEPEPTGKESRPLDSESPELTTPETDGPLSPDTKKIEVLEYFARYLEIRREGDAEIPRATSNETVLAHGVRSQSFEGVTLFMLESGELIALEGPFLEKSLALQESGRGLGNPTSEAEVRPGGQLVQEFTWGTLTLHPAGLVEVTEKVIPSGRG